ncbi:MAG: DUF167 domain-containing protein [Patescibacteria group bacterium]|jgi:hypothetical protein
MWNQESETGTIVFLKVIPKSRESRIVGVFGDFLKVKLNSAPERGKANTELLNLLAIHLELRKTDIEILQGQTDSYKTIFIPLKLSEIESRLF